MKPCRLLSVKFTDSMAATTHPVNPLPSSWHNPKAACTSIFKVQAALITPQHSPKSIRRHCNGIKHSQSQISNHKIKQPAPSQTECRLLFRPVAPLQTAHAAHAFHFRQIRQHARQLVHLPHFQREAHAGFQAARLRVHRRHIHLVPRQTVRHIAQ